MDEIAISRHVVDTFEGVEVLSASGGIFFYYGPDRKLPFATLSLNDEYDQFSDLTRPGVFRLNVGVSKPTFQSLFDSAEGHDFAALNRLMPHPVYGKMYWVCVLSPSGATFEAVRPLLAEAHALAKARHDRNAPPGGETRSG